MKYFANCNTLEELKKEYRRLAMKNHPDNGGDAETMKKINAEYERMFNRLKNIHNSKSDADETGNKKHTAENAHDFIDIINKIIGLEGIEIEICGCWIWVSGNTFDYKDILKAAGFKWANKKKMWYWRKEEDAANIYKKYKTMEMSKIRERYGSEKVSTKARTELTV